jgi:hypothetical protein
VGLAYCLLTCALTFPLVLHLTDRVPHDLGDPLLNTWLLWWNARKMPFSAGWWNGTFFYPLPGVMSFSEHLVGLSPIATPLQWLGGSPLLAYNVSLLASYILSAFAAYLLCLFLTRRHDLAFVGGLAFGFAPYRAGQLAHLQVLSSYYMPLTLLGLHGYLKHRRWPWLLLFASAWLLQALCNGYYLVFLSVLILLWLLWFARDARAVLGVGGAWIIATAPLIPILVQYARWHAHYDLVRRFQELEAFGADVRAFVTASPHLLFWRWLSNENSEAWLFPGGTALIVVALAARHIAGQPLPVATHRRGWRIVLAIFAVAFATAAATAGALGRWRFGMLGLTVSARAIHKPLGLALLMLLALAATTPRMLDSYRRRSPLGFYASATIMLWLFALGPTPRCFGVMIWDKPPYWWLTRLPLLTSLRVPARFAMPAALCLAVAVALGLSKLLPASGRRRRLLLALAAVGVAADGWLTQVALLEPPQPLQLPDVAGGVAATVIELPIEAAGATRAMYRSILHKRPVVNGYSGHEPQCYAILCSGLARYQSDVLAVLQTQGPLLAVVDRTSDPTGEWERMVGSVKEARLARVDGARAIYFVPAVPPDPAAVRRSETPVAISAVRANIAPLLAGRLIDGNVATHWYSASAQGGTERIVLDLGARRDIDAVQLTLGSGGRGYPRGLAIEVSLDGALWHRIWWGNTAARALKACLREPKTVALLIDTPRSQARFVRLRQTERDLVYGWSMAEVAVFGPPTFD